MLSRDYTYQTGPKAGSTVRQYLVRGAWRDEDTSFAIEALAAEARATPVTPTPLSMLRKFDRLAQEYGIRGALHPKHRRKVVRDFRKARADMQALLGHLGASYEPIVHLLKPRSPKNFCDSGSQQASYLPADVNCLECLRQAALAGLGDMPFEK